ncbi:MAG: hypothetical protein ACKOQM_07445 [Novosphingobium sp.]
MNGLVLSLALLAQAGAPAIDPAVTPSKPLAAARAAAPSDSLCDEPALLVMSGSTDVLATFRRSLASNQNFRQLGGYELNGAKASDALSGDAATAQAILRFPCRANALAFWKGSGQQGSVAAAIYPELPLREDLVGKVGDNSYAATFSATTVP